MIVQRWRPRLEIWLWRHGWSWVLALLVALVTVGLQQGALKPARAALASAQDHARDRARAPVEIRPPQPSLAHLQEPLRTAPPAPELARKMAALAQAHGVVASQADYQANAHPGLGLSQLQVTQPVRATYPQFRRYVEAVLREVPSASLDHVSARREHVGQGQLEVRLRWSFWQAVAPLKEAR